MWFGCTGNTIEATDHIIFSYGYTNASSPVQIADAGLYFINITGYEQATLSVTTSENISRIDTFIGTSVVYMAFRTSGSGTITVSGLGSSGAYYNLAKAELTDPNAIVSRIHANQVTSGSETYTYRGLYNCIMLGGTTYGTTTISNAEFEYTSTRWDAAGICYGTSGMSMTNTPGNFRASIVAYEIKKNKVALDPKILIKDGVMNPLYAVTSQDLVSSPSGYGLSENTVGGYVDCVRTSEYNGGKFMFVSLNGISSITIDCQNANTTQFLTFTPDNLTPYHSSQVTTRQQYTVNVSSYTGQYNLTFYVSAGVGSSRLYNVTMQ